MPHALRGRVAVAVTAAAAVLAAAAVSAGLLVTGAGAGQARVAPLATASAARLLLPGAAEPVALVAATPGRPPAQSGPLSAPGDPSLLRAGAAGTAVSPGPDAIGAAAVVRTVRLLGGEVAASAVTVRAVRGRPDSVTVARLSILGRRVAATPGSRHPVGDWAVLEVGARSAVPGGHAIAGLRLRLVAPHRGAPAGAVLEIGRVEVTGSLEPERRAAAARSAAAPAARVVEVTAPGVPLTPGGMAFPLARRTGIADTFGAPRAGVGWHHGIDLFGPTGTPVLAVAAGTLFDVGWNPRGGNRLWLRDAAGNTWYYAHLDAYAPGIRSGARVRAGQPLGTLGRSGDAERTPPHLHIEVHPAAFSGIGYDGAVNPTRILRALARGVDAAVDATPPLPAVRSVATRPGAFLLEAADR